MVDAAVDGIDDAAADDDDGDFADAAAGADAVAAGAAGDAPDGATWAPADDAGPADDADFFFRWGIAFGVARFSRLSASLLSAAVGRLPAHVGGTTKNSSIRNFSGMTNCRISSKFRSRPAAA